MVYMKQLVSTIQDLACQFAKYHYEQHLEYHKVKTIPEIDIPVVVDSIYTDERKDELKQFIRLALKEMCGNDYKSAVVENVLMEMCADDRTVKSRVCTEIEIFQRNLNE